MHGYVVYNPLLLSIKPMLFHLFVFGNLVSYCVRETFDDVIYGKLRVNYDRFKPVRIEKTIASYLLFSELSSFGPNMINLF